MADKKISTINLEIALDCTCCVKKITETLEKYPATEIQTQILYREKKTVTISGPFDPEKLMKCICCQAGKYMKSYIQDQKPVGCRQCSEGQRGGPSWHGWAPHPCPAPICVCLCFEGYEAGPYWSPYAHQVVAGEKNQPAGPCNLLSQC